MDFYARCGDMDSSRRVFDRMLERDLISWNIIVAGYVQNICDYEALMIFQVLMVEILSVMSSRLLAFFRRLAV